VSEVRIVAEPRTEFGKGGARRTRRAGKVPAVVYGHGTKPRHIALPGHDLMMALKTPNVLLNVEIDGKSELTLPKAVQRDPIKGFLEHVDLVVVRRGEKVTVEVPLNFIGDPGPDTLIDYVLNTLNVVTEATNIPTGFDVNIDGIVVGQHITAGQIPLPAGTELGGEADQLVVAGVNAQAAPEEGAEAAEGEEAAAEGAEASAEETAGQATAAAAAE
jgi:large subunit ribosomal protein L25